MYIKIRTTKRKFSIENEIKQITFLSISCDEFATFDTETIFFRSFFSSPVMFGKNKYFCNFFLVCVIKKKNAHFKLFFSSCDF